ATRNINAFGFGGNTSLVSGVMADGGTIRAGQGLKHQIVLAGGAYTIAGSSNADATTQLVVLADGDVARIVTETDSDGHERDVLDITGHRLATGGIGHVRFGSTGASSWLERSLAENADTDPDAQIRSTYTNISSAYLVGGSVGNILDARGFDGSVVFDGTRGTVNEFYLNEHHESTVLGSAGHNTVILESRDQTTVTLTDAHPAGNSLDHDAELAVGDGTTAILNKLSNVTHFRFDVQGDNVQINTAGYSGVGATTLLRHLDMGVAYQEGDEVDLTFVFGDSSSASALPYRMDVAFDGALTLQDILDTISGTALAGPDGLPIRVAADDSTGQAGRILDADDTESEWAYLYALKADLLDGKIVISYTDAAQAAGIADIPFTLLPGMELMLDDDGQATSAGIDADGNVTGSSGVLLSSTAYALGLLQSGQFQKSAVSTGGSYQLVSGQALQVGHTATFLLGAGAGTKIHSGAGDNRFEVAWLNAITGQRNITITTVNARGNVLVVDTIADAVLSDNALVIGADDPELHVTFGGAGSAGMSRAELHAADSSDGITLDAEGWSKAVVLSSGGASATLKGNTSDVTFVTQKPESDDVTISLKASGGTGNVLRVWQPATGNSGPVDVSDYFVDGNLAGIVWGDNTGDVAASLSADDGLLVDNALDLQELDRDLELSGSTVVV
ncbi:MAG TPA: hypothetical protein VK062_03245, partial [Burkholderiaceae bacterium]|nr:hypothetical protein [Burkholderiaceae bacterium]